MLKTKFIRVNKAKISFEKALHTEPKNSLLEPIANLRKEDNRKRKKKNAVKLSATTLLTIIFVIQLMFY